MNRATLFSFAVGLVAVFLFGFSVPGAPSRHPSFGPGINAEITTSKFYMYDPYFAGGASGIPNVLGKRPGGDTAYCNASQAISIADDGGAVDILCLDVATQTALNAFSVPTPSVDRVTTFQWKPDSGMPSIPFTIDDGFGTPIPVGALGAFFTMNGLTGGNWYVRCARASSSGTTTVQLYQHPTIGTTGSTTGVSWAVTNFRTRNIFIGYTATAAANQSAGPRSGIDTTWRGINAGEGGFYFQTRFTLADTAAGHRTAHGLFDTTSALTATSDPNAATNSVYIGCNAADTNLSICSNDATSTATCATLGANFPCNTDNATYDFWLSQAPGAANISYVVHRLDSVVTPAAGQVTTDLPQTSVQLSWQNWHNSAASGAAVQLNWSFTCIADNM